jgi:peptide/nickel transport system substrate-binding protein
MSEQSRTVAELWSDVQSGQISRRDLLTRAALLGLSAPVIASLLAACGDDDDESTADEPAPDDEDTVEPVTEDEDAADEDEDEEPEDDDDAADTPGRRGAGGVLRLLYWQAPDNLNPHFSQGGHNTDPAAIVLEPLLYMDINGELHPVLIDEVPTVDNGMLAPDGTEVTYTLKEGLVWSDGEPFTSEDAYFTWEWVLEEGGNFTSTTVFSEIEEIEIVDERTFIVRFSQPNPAWYNAFSRGARLGGQIVPKHLLDDYRGPDADGAPFNLMPIGTGPYKIVDFRPGDVVEYEINELYREPDKPYFSTVEWKGGGDAASAARAVLETGEVDFTINLQVEPAILEAMLERGTGELITIPDGGVEHLMINFADPWTEIDGARAEPLTQHPFLSDPLVRQALTYVPDRQNIVDELYGPGGETTSNVVTVPLDFVSPNTSWSFDPDRAAELLDEAGWVLEGNVRVKDGVEMTMLYQTTILPVRQKTQEVIKDVLDAIGIPTELKAIDAATFFSADAGNPDTWSHFYADIQMATMSTEPLPINHLRRWASIDPERDVAQQANGWSGRNLHRWINDEYNELWTELSTEIDPGRQAELIIALNDLLIEEVVVIPLVARNAVSAKSVRLKGLVPSPWVWSTYDIANWHFEE